MKNKMNTFAMIGGLLSTLPAFAVVTNQPLPANGSAPQACFIKFTNMQADPSNPFQAQAGCTGTLIRNNRLLTAAHCLDNIVNNGDSVDVICNNGNKDYDVIGYEANPAYNHVVDGSGNTVSDVHDVALFDLKVPKNPVAPIAIESDPTDLASLLLQPQNCALYGYGRPDDGDGNNWGNLVIGVMDYITPQALMNMTGWSDDPTEDIYMGPATHAAPGDSGGPILCKKADGSVIEIATTMERSQLVLNGQTVYLSHHEATTFNADWINAAADKPSLAHKL